MDQTLVIALNNQFTYERYSAAVYEALGGMLDSRNLEGMAKYLYHRGDEEMSHARKFRDYLVDRNQLPVVDALQKPQVTIDASQLFSMGETAFRAALDHERTVTARINALFDLSNQLGDPATHELLLFYVREQVEEEKSLETILTRFELARGDGAALIALDKELGG